MNLGAFSLFLTKGVGFSSLFYFISVNKISTLCFTVFRIECVVLAVRYKHVSFFFYTFI